MATVVVADSGFAQVPVPCDTRPFVLGGLATEVLRVERDTDPFTTTVLAAPDARSFNALGYDVRDGSLYALTTDGSLVGIDGAGAVTDLGAVAGLPAGTAANAGAMDTFGTLFAQSSGGGDLLVVDVDARTASVLALASNPGNLADLAVHPASGLIYAVQSSGDRLFEINPIDGSVVVRNVEGLSPTVYGAQWFDGSGRLFLYANTSGRVVRIDDPTADPPLATDVGGAVPLRRSDGASCVLAPLVELSFSPTTIAAGGKVDAVYRIANPFPSALVGDLIDDSRSVADFAGSGVDESAAPLALSFDGSEVDLGSALGGAVAVSDADRRLAVSGLVVPGSATIEIVATARVDVASAPGVYFEQASLDGASAATTPLAATFLSDFAASALEPDPTPLTVTAAADVSVRKTAFLFDDADGSTTVTPGDRLAYLIEVAAGAGGGAATRVSVADTVPLGLTYVDGSIAGGDSRDDGDAPTLGWEVAAIAPGASVLFEFQAVVDDGVFGSVDNQATVRGDFLDTLSDDPSDPTCDPDTDTPPDCTPDPTVVDVLRPPDVAASKSVVSIDDADMSGDVTPGDRLRYTIVVINAPGAGTATDLTVIDDIPAGLSYVPSSITGGDTAEDGAAPRLVWTVASLGGGFGRSLTFDVLVDPGASGFISNQAVVDGNFDPVDTDDSGDAGCDPVADLPPGCEADGTDVLVGPVDLAFVALDDGPEPVEAGKTVTYTGTVENLSFSEATSVVVSGALPPATSLDSSTVGCTAPGGILACPLGSIAGGASATFSVTLEVDPSADPSGSVTDGPCTGAEDLCLRLRADSAEVDEVPGNDTAEHPTDLRPPRMADLRVDLSSPDGTIVEGGFTTVTVTVTNDGPDSATATEVELSFDGSFLPQVTTVPCTEIEAGRLSCPLGDLAVAETRVFSITGHVPIGARPSGRMVTCSTATALCVAGMAEADEGDPNPSAARDEELLTLLGRVSGADVSVIKRTVTPSPVAPGDTVIYELFVTNRGPGAALDVRVVDTFPVESLEYVSDDGGCAPEGVGALVCPLGDLPASTSASILVEFLVPLSAPASVPEPCTSEGACNRAFVAATETDGNPDDNNDEEPIDVSLTLNCGNGSQDPGEQCEPPDGETCNNGLDDDGDGAVDCGDPDCADAVAEGCNASCQTTPVCSPILRDPAIIRLYGEPGRKDFIKIHGQIPATTTVDPVGDGFYFRLSNADGVIYETRLFPNDLSPNPGSPNKLWRFNDRTADRPGQGIRGGVRKLSIRRRLDLGPNTYTFRILAFGDLSAATLDTMTTDVLLGDDPASLTATWRRKSGRFTLKPSDF